MAKLNRLRARFVQIQNIKKMTNVMEMIANAKIPKIKNQFKSAQEYFENLDYIFQNIVNNLGSKIDEFIKTESKKNLYIIFGSNLGFCGALNNLIIKKITPKLKENDEIIVFSKKIYNFLSINQSKLIIKYYQNIEESNFSEPILQVTNLIYQAILAKKYNKILICYNKFISIIHSKPQVHNLLEFQKNIIKYDGYGPEFEPSATEVFEKLMPFYIKSVLEKLFIESKLVETSARRASMESATENASEILRKLELEINSSRQTMITQEIIEIISGKM
ncbi:F0F1 ATP synthase subunit gamma [Mycoplasma flocculare]|uniref:F0F1 ATP synthase subunit gamma n=1 Tax=Mesomycoplasma flocculare TaxID=2128 RepID=A0AAW9XBF8_MESFC|nr:FoF1 ATP synthase subunit gamma [Mesomycoplasma flocculare]MXR05670.1 F0F1 ATP synthase subunit gamma [Mesomycoplasma flocculare]MXR12040.1 F0F1 ATP synthase subunit gamma [Mesomycoplasma flocculare]MXR39256.1 F0F1 ATP synthase subunit gamma [Mycoplasma sp. MF12]MXR56554.1 F0F1 ATP synthase subunit gamma [Mesomycoplasma flocculare]